MWSFYLTLQQIEKTNKMNKQESLIDLINQEDDNGEILVVYPFGQQKFEQWMRQAEGLTEETIDKQVKYFMDGCEAVDDELVMNLHELLESYIRVIPETTGSNLTKEFAVDLIEMYHDFIEELVANGREDLRKAPRAFNYYKKFLMDYVDHPDKCVIKKLEVPYKDEFINWLETDLHKSYLNAKKDVYALQSAEVWVSVLFNFEDYDLFNRLAKMNNKADRQRVLDLLREYKNEAPPEAFKKVNINKKTVSNGLSCLKTYINFLNQKEKTV